jgi:probable HAF family extracellular repeat protein
MTTAQSDTTPPDLTGLSFSPTSVDVTSAPAAVTVNIGAHDAGSGVDWATMTLSSPSRGQSASCGSSVPSSGTINDGVFSCQLTINKGAEPGVWSTSLIRLDDVTGNIAFPSSAAFPATVTVTSIPSACDINQDGTMNVSDVQLIVNQVLGVKEAISDINDDGVVNVVDAQIVINAALGLDCSSTLTQTLASQDIHRTSSVTSDSVSRIAKQCRTEQTVIRAGIAGSWPSCEVIDLGTLGGSSSTAYAINNLGQVVGVSATREFDNEGPGCSYDRCPMNHAFLWDSGNMMELAFPGSANAINSIAHSINNVGQVVGADYQSGYPRTRFFYSRETAADFNLVSDGNATAINDAGQIVGISSADGAPSSTQAFLWDKGELIVLPTLGGSASEAFGINGYGEVVGSSYSTSDSAVHAFRYSDATLTDLGTLGGTNSAALGINDSGQIVGFSETGDGLRHAFLYSGARMVDLLTLGGTESRANGINRSGAIVGWAKTANGEQHASLWSSGRVVDLNGFAPLGPDVILIDATAINDIGQIVANANNGRAYLILLTPLLHCAIRPR